MFLAVFTSCEEQPVVIPQFEVEDGNRKVMIEELTGVSCAPCFDGAAVIEDLVSSYPGRVIINGIHGSFQSDPTSESKYDFRYPDATALENSFFFLGKPATLIDRVKFEDQDFVTIDNRDSWKGKVVERLAVPSPATLTATSTFDSATRLATFNVTIGALEDIPGAMKLFVFVNESELKDAQLSVSMGIVKDFKHKHVMKAALTTVNGDIVATDISAGETITRNYSYTVPPEENEEWIPENMEFAYFITSVDQNDEVLQANSKHMTE